jgi:hypothetical protein
MAVTLKSLWLARESAEIRLADAQKGHQEAEARLRKFGLELFTQALAAKGIKEGSPVILDGNYSGGWGDKVRNLKHDRSPVILLGVSVDFVPWTNPAPQSTTHLWWFRLTIARRKKDGTPRDEYRNTLVSGRTPEAAAAEVEAP